MHKPESVKENETLKILCNFAIQSDHLSLSGLRSSEPLWKKRDKYLDLARKLFKKYQKN